MVELTGHRAVVVTVEKKVRDIAPEERLPETVEGVRVDVRQASLAKVKELLTPADYAGELRVAPDLGSVPHFADEVGPDGAPIGVGASAHQALAAAVAKVKLDYSSPAGARLVPVTGEVTIHLAASPDAGWSLLQQFLRGVTGTLTVGLYDFTSAHVLDAVTAALVGKKLNLTLDHPAKNPTADQTDAQAVEALDQALSSSTGSTCAQAWALSRMDPEASAWIFATAYHIKVAVADDCAVLALQRELEQLQRTRHRPCRRRIWLTRRRSRTSRRPGLACDRRAPGTGRHHGGLPSQRP